MKLKLLIVITGFFQIFGCHTQVFAQSPYKLSWPVDGIISGTALVTGIIGKSIILNMDPLTDEQINSLSREDVNAFDRPATDNYSTSISTTGDVLVLVYTALPLTLYISQKVRSDFVTFGLMYLESLGLEAGVTQFFKGIHKRIRPFVYNENVPLESKRSVQARLSFPSGHTAHAFTMAVFLSITYSDYFSDSKLKPFVWGGSLALASVIGYTRVASGQHFPTDALVGAAVGSAIGYFVPKLHRRKTDRGFSALPVYGEGQVQLSLNFTF